MDKTIRYLNGKFPLKKDEIRTELIYPYKNKFALLIAILLSASSSDKQVNKITGKLFKKAPTPEAMIKLGKKASVILPDFISSLLLNFMMTLLSSMRRPLNIWGRNVTFSNSVNFLEPI